MASPRLTKGHGAPPMPRGGGAMMTVSAGPWIAAPDCAATTGVRPCVPGPILPPGHRAVSMIRTEGSIPMRKEADNKAVVGRWFTQFWGRDADLAVVDEIAAPDMLLQYSLH